MLQSNLEFELDFSIGFLVFENFQTIDIITLDANCEVIAISNQLRSTFCYLCKQQNLIGINELLLKYIQTKFSYITILHICIENLFCLSSMFVKTLSSYLS